MNIYYLKIVEYNQREEIYFFLLLDLSNYY